MLIEQNCIIEPWYSKDHLSNREITYHFGYLPQTADNYLKRGECCLKDETNHTVNVSYYWGASNF